MNDLIENIQIVGAFSLDSIWFPLLIWTVCCLLAFCVLRVMNTLNPLFHYHLRTAALLSLPLGTMISFLLKLIPEWIAKPDLETSFFVVQSPIELVISSSDRAIQQSINWNEPNFYIGLITMVIVAISLIMVLKFLSGYMELRKHYKELDLQYVSDISTIKTQTPVKVAFMDHPLVPYTFGWKNPVIVLPDMIKSNSEKLQMALQHEMIHIQRGDYLLQLALALVESIFWFHPLIHFANREIDIYREISCDQEVLSKSGFSIKSYANLLYELVPLNSGVGKLSVSMAVQNSTLKQRIKTMKQYKLYHTSFKQSIFFLLLMVAGITIPIACSDLQGPQGMTDEEIAVTKFEMVAPQLEINGVVVGKVSTAKTGLAYDGYIFMADKYGAFIVSGRRFDGAVLKGMVTGNTLTFTLNSLKTTVTTEAPILENKRSSVWVRHFPESKSVGLYLGKLPASLLSDASNLEEILSSFGNVNSEKKENMDNGDYFVVVEQMPEPIGGIAAIQSKVQYPEMARRAGIEGRVTVQFIVNENGDVENAKVVRGIGGGCDEAALKVVREAKFTPGIQKGQPVRVRFALSINFRLSDADYSNALHVEHKNLSISLESSNKGAIAGFVKDSEGNPMVGANVMLETTNIGVATDQNGHFEITGLNTGSHVLEISFVGYSTTQVSAMVK